MANTTTTSSSPLSSLLSSSGKSISIGACWQSEKQAALGFMSGRADRKLQELLPAPPDGFHWELVVSEAEKKTEKHPDYDVFFVLRPNRA